MDGYYVVGVTTISYLGIGCIVNIVSKEERNYLVLIANNPQCIYLDFARMSSMRVGKRVQWVCCKHLYYVFRYLCKVD